MSSIKEQIEKLVNEGASSFDLFSSLGIDPSMTDANTLNVIASLFEMLSSMMKEMKELTGSVKDMGEKFDNMSSTIKELTSGINSRSKTDSTNSSLPPSSDGYGKMPASKKRSMRVKSGLKPGAQDGHKGNGLAKVAADMTEEKKHYPKTCLGNLCPSSSYVPLLPIRGITIFLHDLRYNTAAFSLQYVIPFNASLLMSGQTEEACLCCSARF